MSKIGSRLSVVLVASLAAWTDAALASDDEIVCYDISVMARIVDEVPSAYPDCGSDCIIMSWPWFIDLKVDRVLEGDLRGRNLTALAVLHTRHSRSGNRMQKRLLRRNSEGGFNMLRSERSERISRCPADTLPMRAYLIPGAGQTLGSLRHEGEELYARYR